MGVESSLSECQLNRFLKSYPQDLLMFGWVESVKRNMPSVKIRDAIRQYLDWANIDGDIGAHEVTYYRMATKLRESEKTT